MLSGGLEVDHAHGELVLHRAQLGATDLGLLGDRSHPPRRLPPGPLARELMDAEGHAAAGVAQPLRGHLLTQVPRRIAHRDGVDRVHIERLEEEGTVGGQTRERPGATVAGEHEHQHGNVGDGLRHGDKAGAHVVTRAVRVVDDHQGRAPCLASADEYPEHGVGGACARGIEDGGTGGVGLAGQLGRQAALPDPVLAMDRDEDAGAGAGLLPALAQPGELRAASFERRRRGGVELARQVGDDQLGLERGVLAQDRLLEAAELRAGLDADLGDEDPASLAVGLERLGLAAAAVEREHELPGQPLAGRVDGDELLQLADELRLAAGREVGLHARLDGGETLLVQPRDLGLRERLEGELGERRSAP